MRHSGKSSRCGNFCICVRRSVYFIFPRRQRCIFLISCPGPRIVLFQSRNPSSVISSSDRIIPVFMILTSCMVHSLFQYHRPAYFTIATLAALIYFLIAQYLSYTRVCLLNICANFTEAGSLFMHRINTSNSLCSPLVNLNTFLRTHITEWDTTTMLTIPFVTFG